MEFLLLYGFLDYFRYRLIGSSEQICKADGKWSEDVPSCIHINCSIPELIINGKVHFDSITYGFNITFSCNQGYVTLIILYSFYVKLIKLF